MTREDRIMLERKQREALFEQRDALWALAQRGYRATGRGLVVADGRNLGRRGEVPVFWRPGAALLGCSADAQEWIRRSAECVRSYDPEQELVVQYWSPSNQVHLYRIRMRPQSRREGPVAPANVNVRGEAALLQPSDGIGARRSWAERLWHR